MIAKKIHHPHMQVKKAQAPPAIWSRPARIALPRAACQKVAVRQAKLPIRDRKIRTKTKFVRRARMK